VCAGHSDSKKGLLLAAPDQNAAVVIDAEDEIISTAILDCKGSWFRIETPLSTKDQHLTPKLPSDGPPARCAAGATAPAPTSGRPATMAGIDGQGAED